MSTFAQLWMLVLALQTSPAAPATSLRTLSDGYLSALCHTLTRGATESDVEQALSFCADDMVYEHPALGVRIEGKANIREGMLSHLDSYAGTEQDSGLEVLSRIVAKDAVVVRVRETFQVERDGKKETIEREKLKVIEFKDGRIRRVLDY